MTLPTPVPGLVISYAYLWRTEQQAGGAGGRKVGPCAIVVAAKDEDGDTVAYVAPTTHTPSSEGAGLEIPAKVKQHLGLDAARSWIITDELNRFVWPGYDLRPIARDRPDVFHWGFPPVELFEALKGAVLQRRRVGQLGVVPRE